MKLTEKLHDQQKIVRLCQLPYPGDILVAKGQIVEPDTIVAQTTLISGSPAFFDIRREMQLSGDDFQAALRVKLHDMVTRDQVLVEATENKEIKPLADQVGYPSIYNSKHMTQPHMTEDKVLSPFDGWVEYISISNGNLLIRQSVRENEPPLIIEASKELKLKPKALKHLALVKTGQRVVRMQSVAGDIEFVYTPMAGTVGEISTEHGTIEIIPNYDPTILRAGLYGVVKECIPPWGVAIETTATTLQGVFAAGPEQHGFLAYWDGKVKSLKGLQKPAIVYTDTTLSFQQLKQAEQAGVKGIIATSSSASDLIDYYGDNIAKGITGKEARPCSVMLIQGFGDDKMPEDVLEWFKLQEGRSVTLQTETRLLPPLEYPKLVLYSRN